MHSSKICGRSRRRWTRVSSLEVARSYRSKSNALKRSSAELLIRFIWMLMWEQFLCLYFNYDMSISRGNFQPTMNTFVNRVLFKPREPFQFCNKKKQTPFPSQRQLLPMLSGGESSFRPSSSCAQMNFGINEFRGCTGSEEHGQMATEDAISRHPFLRVHYGELNWKRHPASFFIPQNILKQSWHCAIINNRFFRDHFLPP